MTTQRTKPSLKKRLNGFKHFISQKITTPKTRMSRTTSMPILISADFGNENRFGSTSEIKQKRNSLFVLNSSWTASLETASLLRPETKSIWNFDRPRSECFHLPEEDERVDTPPTSQSAQVPKKFGPHSTNFLGSNLLNVNTLSNSSIDSPLHRGRSSFYTDSSFGDENEGSDSSSLRSNRSEDSRKYQVPDVNANYIVHPESRKKNKQKKLHFPKPKKNQNLENNVPRSSSLDSQYNQRPKKKYSTPNPPLWKTKTSSSNKTLEQNHEDNIPRSSSLDSQYNQRPKKKYSTPNPPLWKTKTSSSNKTLEQNHEDNIPRSSSLENQLKHHPQKKFSVPNLPVSKPKMSLLDHAHDKRDGARINRTESMKKSINRARSFSVKKKRSNFEKRKRLSAEGNDIFDNIHITLSSDDLKYLMKLEVETILLNKQYDQKLCLKWCKEISTKVRDRIRHKLEKTFKIIVSTYIGQCKDSNEDTVHVTMQGLTDPDKDRFLTVALHNQDLFAWVTLGLFEAP